MHKQFNREQNNSYDSDQDARSTLRKTCVSTIVLKLPHTTCTLEMSDDLQKNTEGK